MPYENDNRNGCLVLCCLNTHVSDAAAKYWKRNARKERTQKSKHYVQCSVCKFVHSSVQYVTMEAISKICKSLG